MSFSEESEKMLMLRARAVADQLVQTEQPVLLLGPPGSGKTMIARRVAMVLAEHGAGVVESPQVAFEATLLHRAAGLFRPDSGSTRLDAFPRPAREGYEEQLRIPFRAPHHTVSAAGMSGQYREPRSQHPEDRKVARWLYPGECSLAHGGLLFLDEAPEFRRDVLNCVRVIHRERHEALRLQRQPPMLGRTQAPMRTVRLPASFHLLLAANPCPCGWREYRGPPSKKACSCSQDAVERYLQRVTDYFPDMHIWKIGGE